jgi:hypothetical protein
MEQPKRVQNQSHKSLSNTKRCGGRVHVHEHAETCGSMHTSARNVQSHDSYAWGAAVNKHECINEMACQSMCKSRCKYMDTEASVEYGMCQVQREASDATVPCLIDVCSTHRERNSSTRNWKAQERGLEEPCPAHSSRRRVGRYPPSWQTQTWLPAEIFGASVCSCHNRGNQPHKERYL